MPLPDKPSELILLALSDLRKVEADPKYTVDMAKWHQFDGETCFVCLAGSVMAKTIRNRRTRYIVPEYLPKNLNKKFYAINNFRNGQVWYGLNALGIKIPKKVPAEYPITPYSFDRERFHEELTALATFLAEHGL